MTGQKNGAHDDGLANSLLLSDSCGLSTSVSSTTSPHFHGAYWDPFAPYAQESRKATVSSSATGVDGRGLE